MKENSTTKRSLKRNVRVFLTEEEFEELQSIAKHQGCSMSHVLRQGLGALAIERERSKMRFERYLRGENKH